MKHPGTQRGPRVGPGAPLLSVSIRLRYGHPVAYQWVPYVISIGNVASFLFALRGLRLLGSISLLSAQAIFVCYAALTGQPGFLFQNVLMIGSALYGILVSWRGRRRPEPELASPADEFPASWADHG